MALQILVTKDSLQNMLNEANFERQQHIIGRALVAIFERQTASEQHALHTEENNGVGFAGCDAVGGSLTAKSYMRHKALLQWQVDKAEPNIWFRAHLQVRQSAEPDCERET